MSLSYPTVASLSDQIARLSSVDPNLLRAVAREAVTEPHEWVVDSGGYQSGGWWTCSLLNDSGDPRKITLRAAAGQAVTSDDHA